MNVDALKYTNKLFERLYSKAYIDLVNKAPGVLGWLYDSLDTPWENEKLRLAFDKLNTKPLMRLLRDFAPDVCICTHFLPSEIISWLKAKEKITTKLAVVVTDFYVHAMWLCRPCENYFVACDEARVYLETLGIPREAVNVTGIPIHPRFAVPAGKAEMRTKYGLDQSTPVVLLSSGGFGVGSVQAMLEGLFRVKHELQIVPICRRNTALYESLQALHVPPGKRLRVIGFTREMDELMTAADLIVGKPGGLTTSEALAKGLAFVVVNPIPGQEERNSDYLLEEGAAIKCNSLPTLPFKIDKLLGDSSGLARMRERARALGHVDAARRVLKAVCT